MSKLEELKRKYKASSLAELLVIMNNIIDELYRKEDGFGTIDMQMEFIMLAGELGINVRELFIDNK